MGIDNTAKLWRLLREMERRWQSLDECQSGLERRIAALEARLDVQDGLDIEPPDFPDVHPRDLQRWADEGGS